VNDYFRPKFKRRNRSSATINVRLIAYLSAVFAKGTRVFIVDFDALARSFKCTRRTVEMAVKKVREAGRFVFRTVRAGRSYVVQVSDRNPCIKGVFLLTKKKEIQNNTARPAALDLKKSSSWISKPAPRPIQALAGWLARNVLAREHRAASRTMFRFGHAYNFAVDALHAGHAKADLIDAWRYALRNVDSDLSNLPASIRWEPSSLVSLARRRLADGLSAACRVAQRRKALIAQNGPAKAVFTVFPKVKSTADFVAEFDALCAV
jgi:hypothetical protein